MTTSYAELEQLEQGLRAARVAAAATQARYDALRARGISGRALFAAQQAALTAADAAAATLGARDAALDANTARLDTGVPLLLLPVRLETRFGTGANGSVMLKIRVYPDDIHFDSHRPELTPAELQAGQAYWSSMQTASGTADALAAWASLARAAGPARVEWVARATTPRAGPAPASTDGSWLRAERATLLPDAWVATAWRGGQQIATARGGLVARPLHVGPDPALAAAQAGAGGIDPGMRWMTDFAAALSAGMGIEMPLPDAGPIELLTVVGVRASDPAALGAPQLADLLEGHRYTVGLDLLAPGAPTNNTAEAPSALGAPHPSGADSFIDPRTGAAVVGADLAALNAAFGFAPGLLPPMQSQDLAASAREQDMASALWPGTWGYYLTQMLRLDEYQADPARWRGWMLKHLRGGGPLPTLRIGKQPYGILPITLLNAWRPQGASLALVVAELGPVRGRPQLGGRRRTLLRLLDELDGGGAWNAAAGMTDGPAPPPDATGLALALADLDDSGRTVALFGFAGTAIESRAGLNCPIGRLHRHGWQASGTLTIPTGHIGKRVTGIALAFGALPGSMAVRGQSDLVAVLQGQDGHGRAALVLCVAQAVTESGAVGRWSDPVDISTLLALGHTVQSVVLTPSRRALNLVLLSAPDAASQPGQQSHQCVGSELSADGVVAGGWSRPLPFGVAMEPGIVPAGAALTRLPGDARGRVAAAQYFMAGRSLIASYAVYDDDRFSGALAISSGPFNLGAVAPGAIAGACAAVRWPRVRSAKRGLGDAGQAANLLQFLQQSWLNAAGTPVRAGVGDPTRALLDILATDAVSSRYDTRPFVGDSLLGTFSRVMNPLDQPGPPTDAASVIDLIKSALGLTLSAVPAGEPASRILHGQYLAHASAPTQPLIAPGETPPRWIDALIAATPQVLHSLADDTKAPLLARLLSHSLLQAYSQAALLATDRPAPLREPEFIDMPDYAQADPSGSIHTPTSWRYLTEEQQSGRPLDQLIHDAARAKPAPPWAQPVADLLAALGRLKDLAAADLERAAANVLDTSTHRLDAWITAFASDLLRQRRAARPDGLAIGAYGMVIDLVRKSAATSTGYVYAPSMTHAATAAILRSGYLSHGAGQLDIDLSSRRVRGAKALIEAVRQGQSLGGFLGQHAERALHDSGLDVYLEALRELAPLEVGVLTPKPANTSAASVSGMVRIDGKRLLALRDAGFPWGQEGMPASGSTDGMAIDAILAALADAVDAIADIGVAESVHQSIQRNQIRAAAALDAVSRGDAPLPDDPDVLRLPRSGIGVTHRILLATPQAASGAWGGGPRARAEPRLNAWATRALPDPAGAYWSASFHDANGAEVGHLPFVLSDLGLSALDLLASASPAVADPTQTELGRRLLLHADTQGRRRLAFASVRVRLAPDPARAPQLSLAEFLTVAGALRSVALAARPARAQDLAGSGQSAAVVQLAVAARELQGRLREAVGTLDTALTGLRAPFHTSPAQRAAIAALYPSAPMLDNLLDLPKVLDLGAALDLFEPDQSALLGHLFDIAGFGVAGAVPAPAIGAKDKQRVALSRQARVVAQAAKARLEAVRPALAADAAGSESAISDLIDAISALFGDGFLALPLLSAALPADPPPGFDEEHAQDWLDGVAMVREPVARLRDAGILAQSAGGARPRWTVRQHLAGAPSAWVGLAPPAGQTVPAGATSLALVGVDADWLAGDTLAALVIDSWVEVIPSASADTALAFHFDAPDSAAPQAMLLAVHPDPERAWDAGLLSELVCAAADLAKVRSIDPHRVPIAGHLLPALLMPTNTGGDAIAVDLGA